MLLIDLTLITVWSRRAWPVVSYFVPFCVSFSSRIIAHVWEHACLTIWISILFHFTLYIYNYMSIWRWCLVLPAFLRPDIYEYAKFLKLWFLMDPYAPQCHKLFCELCLCTFAASLSLQHVVCVLHFHCCPHAASCRETSDDTPFPHCLERNEKAAIVLPSVVSYTLYTVTHSWELSLSECLVAFVLSLLFCCVGVILFAGLLSRRLLQLSFDMCIYCCSASCWSAVLCNSTFKLLWFVRFIFCLVPTLFIFITLCVLQSHGLST